VFRCRSGHPPPSTHGASSACGPKAQSSMPASVTKRHRHEPAQDEAAADTAPLSLNEHGTASPSNVACSVRAANPLRVRGPPPYHLGRRDRARIVASSYPHNPRSCRACRSPALLRLAVNGNNCRVAARGGRQGRYDRGRHQSASPTTMKEMEAFAWRVDRVAHFRAFSGDCTGARRAALGPREPLPSASS